MLATVDTFILMHRKLDFENRSEDRYRFGRFISARSSTKKKKKSFNNNKENKGGDGDRWKSSVFSIIH